MKKILFISLFLFALFIPAAFSQTSADTSVYMITCGPGTETYSIYGHSALRIVIPEKKTDIVYNWGMFDFSTPNFAWKFAKGRLNYMVGEESIQNFLQIYVYEKRFVISQKINLSKSETKKLLELLTDNLRPENVNYRYDFFYDDCSTRIRDLLEKSIGNKLLYPPVETKKMPTFREMTGKYQNPFPWLNLGIDLIMGSPGDKKASFRDRMFLPLDMQTGLSETVVNREGKMIPLLQNPTTILDFNPLVVRKNFVTTPVFLFTLLMVITIILSAWLKNVKIIKLLDIIIFSVFSILALLMIFFNFFTDHLQMKLNLNMLWLNPLIIICLVSLLSNRPGLLWYRIVFFISAFFLVFHFFLPQEFNLAFIPLAVILLIRSSVRARFEWNPLSLE